MQYSLQEENKFNNEISPLRTINGKGIKRDHGTLSYRFFKRSFDIVFSFVVITVLFVPSLLLCLIIRIESEGSPIYVQERVYEVDEDGRIKTFNMYKFRSMYKNADRQLEILKTHNEADGLLFKMKDDPRVTKVGKTIREHSIDEFPQFINVFLGQLSVVGPRPALPEEVVQYDEFALQRLKVKPGLTGYWQVADRTHSSFQKYLELDLKYIKDRGFVTDMKLIKQTVRRIFEGNNEW